VKKLIVLGTGAFGAAAVAMGLFGAGLASAAPDVVGQTYADASSAIDEEGLSAVVAVTVGGRLPQDECIVTNAQDAPYVRDDGGEFTHSEDEVLLSLNCNGGHATATNPGASVASMQGKAAIEAEEEAKNAEAAELEGASTPDE
jgi:hypothetical protein